MKKSSLKYWKIFVNIHTKMTVFNFVDQYLIFALNKHFERNSINFSMSFLFNWWIVISKFHILLSLIYNINNLLKFEKTKIEKSINVFFKFFQIFKHFLIETKMRMLFFLNKCFVVHFWWFYQLVDFQSDFVCLT